MANLKSHASLWHSLEFRKLLLSRVFRDVSLPKGVTVRKNGNYLVVWNKEDGKSGYKIAKNIEEALAFHANPTSTDGADEEEAADGEAGQLHSAAEPIDEQAGEAEESEQARPDP